MICDRLTLQQRLLLFIDETTASLLLLAFLTAATTEPLCGVRPLWSLRPLDRHTSHLQINGSVVECCHLVWSSYKFRLHRLLRHGR